MAQTQISQGNTNKMSPVLAFSQQNSTPALSQHLCTFKQLTDTTPTHTPFSQNKYISQIQHKGPKEDSRQRSTLKYKHSTLLYTRLDLTNMDENLFFTLDFRVMDQSFSMQQNCLVLPLWHMSQHETRKTQESMLPVLLQKIFIVDIVLKKCFK